MGLDKNKRPILAVGGLEVPGGSTFTGTVVMSGAGVTDTVQSLTGASTGTTITNYGITLINVVSSTESTSAAASIGFTMAGVSAGVQKTLVVSPQSTEAVAVSLAAGDNLLGMSTKQTILYFTTSASTGESAAKTVHLVGLTTKYWGLGSLPATTAGAPSVLLTSAS